MFRKMIIAATALMLATPAMAERETRVFYMEVDQGQELMDRDTQAFQRIYEHTGNYLSHENIHLFEENDQTEERRTFGEALELARKAQGRKMDALVMVSVKHTGKRVGPKIKDRMVAIAKIVDARSLEIVDTIRVKSPIATIKKHNCKKECRKMVMRRHVREILPEFKERLANGLHDFRSVTKHVAKSASELTLTLKGFNSREVRFLEDRIARLDNTRDLSSLTSSPGKPAFWLERRRNAGNVRDDLSEVLAQLDLQARIIQTSRQVTLVKVNRDLAYLD